MSSSRYHFKIRLITFRTYMPSTKPDRRLFARRGGNAARELGSFFFFRLCSPSRRAKKLARELIRSLYGNFSFLFFFFFFLIEESKSKSNPAITICCSVDQEISNHTIVYYMARVLGRWRVLETAWAYGLFHDHERQSPVFDIHKLHWLH
jgi:hypothetical protein